MRERQKLAVEIAGLWVRRNASSLVKSDREQDVSGHRLQNYSDFDFVAEEVELTRGKMCHSQVEGDQIQCY